LKPDPDLYTVLRPTGFLCIAIGDIEGDNKKLRIILNYIRSHEGISFVFLGDLVDDISDRAANRESQLQCLFDLEPYFEPSANSLDFHSISFEPGTLATDGRIQFIAGNSENDILQDLRQSPAPAADGESLVFGNGKWQKTFRPSELNLVYRYLRSCRSEILSDQDDAIVHFRHAATLVWTGERNGKSIQSPDGANPVVCGHNRNIGRGSFSNDQEDVVMLDTSAGVTDVRLGAVGWDGRILVSLIALSMPGLSDDTMSRLTGKSGKTRPGVNG
jgi:hypothetical protein